MVNNYYETKLIDPSNEEEWIKVYEGDAKDVDIAVEAASKAWKPWSQLPAYVRSGALRKWSKLIQENALTFGKLEAQGMGRPVSQGGFDIGVTCGVIEYFASLCDTCQSTTTTTTPGHFNFVLKQPFGVTGKISLSF